MNRKQIAGQLAAATLPQCKFEQSIFLLGHMRCGSTALSKVICNHGHVSGYGEAHIAYKDRSSLGVLALNQLRRRAFRPTATRLFDKILHSRYDLAAHSDFFRASAVFLIRPPVETIRSIRKLFSAPDMREYASHAAAADYYEERMTTLARMWERFPAERRIALTYPLLTADPDTWLAAISVRLGLAPALGNHYAANSQIHAPGAGDPLSAHRFDRIVASELSTTIRRDHDNIDISQSRVDELLSLYYNISRIMVDKMSNS